MDKKRLLFPLFVLKLFLVNVFFFISIAFIPIHRQKLLFFSGITFLLYILFLGKYILPRKPQLTDPIKLINVKSQQGTMVSFKDFSKLELFEKKLTGLNKLSPNNRDILVNLSLISFYQNKIEDHVFLWDKALETDPNNHIFKDN